MISTVVAAVLLPLTTTGYFMVPAVSLLASVPSSHPMTVAGVWHVLHHYTMVVLHCYATNLSAKTWTLPLHSIYCVSLMHRQHYTRTPAIISKFFGCFACVHGHLQLLFKTCRRKVVKELHLMPRNVIRTSAPPSNAQQPQPVSSKPADIAKHTGPNSPLKRLNPAR